MKIKLSQFALFQCLQIQLDAITAEQLVTVKAGTPLETDQKVVGTLPDHLKALLYLRDQISDEARKLIDTLPDDVMSEKALKELAKLKQAREKANDLFWNAIKAEFKDLADKASIGYGPNFEVYYNDTAQERSSLAEILHGALIVHLG